MLQQADGVEYMEGLRMRIRAPDFSYRIQGEIMEDEDGRTFVAVTLTDAARKEQIASYVAPASTDPASLAAVLARVDGAGAHQIAPEPGGGPAGSGQAA